MSFRRQTHRSGASNNVSQSSSGREQVREQWRRADDIVAATAGLNTWKTWAGRNHGDDSMEYLDIFRGIKRIVQDGILGSGVPREGATCPVCLCEAEDWYKTSSCGHFVCRNCFRMYAESQIRDFEHHGPLKCPVCPLPLRQKDAIAALTNNHELLRLWDDRLRNQVLRALPNFRHCPHCDDDTRKPSSASSSTLRGGFVTSDCLSPLHEYREYAATQILNNGIVLLNVGCGICVCAGSAFIATFTPFGINVWLSLICHRLAVIFLEGRIARAARRTLFEPIVVGCPCCDKEFVLQAESETPGIVSKSMDQKSKDWIGANTRPCPSCSVPIYKVSGCNHMRCSHCRAHFCWACMRPRTRCGAYDCANGARYGNSKPPGQNSRRTRTAENNNQSIFDQIASLEQHAQNEILPLLMAFLVFTSFSH